MSDNEQIKITCDQFGNVEIDADGYKGTKCAEDTSAFAMAFSGGSRKDNTKEDFYSPATTVTKQGLVY